MQKYYVSRETGKYLGSFDDSGIEKAKNPYGEDAIEVHNPPATANVVWDFVSLEWKIPLDVLKASIKSEAGRRIDVAIPMWMTQREVLGGTAVPDELKSYASAVRSASERLEVELPQDYADDKHWPERV